MSTIVKSRIGGIKELVATMHTLPQLDAPVKHYFSDGIYAREIIMPAGMLLVGKIHTTRHLNMLSKGSCTVVTPTRTLDLTAPCTFESFEGEQKVIYAHSEVVWTTLHVTEETDLVKIEEQCITEEYDEQLVNKLIRVLPIKGEQS